MKPEEAACEGLFLAFQYPVEIPGISNAYFLRSALNAIRKYRGQEEMDAMDFLPKLREKLKLLEMDEKLLNRSVNEGVFRRREKAQRNSADGRAGAEAGDSGRNRFGLDIDALQDRRQGVNAMRSPDRAMLRGHALSAAAELHRSGLRPRAGGRPHREVRRARSWRWTSKKRATAGFEAGGRAPDIGCEESERSDRAWQRQFRIAKLPRELQRIREAAAAAN